jgi:uncharacterized protein (TIGR00725 family)
MKVTVFGGASPRPGEPAYEEAYQLGRFLGESGHIIITGGYIGTMEAVSRGASEAGAHVVGVTCEEIENWRTGGPNPWVKEEWRCQTLFERLEKLMSSCDAAIALPGGVGTLAEVALLWNRKIIEATRARQLVLVGDGWKKVFDAFQGDQGAYIHSIDQSWLSFAPGVKEAVDQLII